SPEETVRAERLGPAHEGRIRARLRGIRFFGCGRLTGFSVSRIARGILTAGAGPGEPAEGTGAVRDTPTDEQQGAANGGELDEDVGLFHGENPHSWMVCSPRLPERSVER